MTEAYIMGFCKTAEACGVDPDQLVKAAQAAAFLRSLKGLGSAAKGFGNALGATGWLGARTVANGAGQLARKAVPAAQKAMQGVRNAGRTLRSDFMRGFRPNGPAMGIPR